MAFGRKKNVAEPIKQEEVFQLASEVLRKKRAIRLRLATKITLTSPLMMQRWTTKAVRKLLGGMTGFKEPKTNKDLTADYADSWYRNELGEPVLPCRILKAAIVEAAGSTNGVVSKAALKRSLIVLGNTMVLKSAKKGQNPAPKMDVKIVKNANGQPDVRSRAVFPAGTTMEVVLEFGHELTVDQVLSAFDAAGSCIGLCEWRPEKGGSYGTFGFEPVENSARNIERIVKECSSPEDEFVIPPALLRAFNSIPEEKRTDGARKVQALIDNHAQQRGLSTTRLCGSATTSLSRSTASCRSSSRCCARCMTKASTSSMSLCKRSRTTSSTSPRSSTASSA
jgi:hypothetical protein